MNYIPDHAELPSWEELSTEKKKERNQQWLESIQAYSLKFFKAPHFEHASYEQLFNTDQNALRKRLLNEYNSVLENFYTQIKKILSTITAHDAKESADIESTLHFINNHPNALYMGCEPGHITCSSLVVDLSTRKIVLHKHKKLGMWLQFGGHTDFDISLPECALRECIEESGLSNLEIYSPFDIVDTPVDIEVQSIPKKGNRPEHKHYDFRYLVTTNSATQTSVSADESDEFWWTDIPTALNTEDSLINPNLKRLIEKAQLYIFD